MVASWPLRWKRVQTECGDGGGVGHIPDTEHAAFFVEFINRLVGFGTYHPEGLAEMSSGRTWEVSSGRLWWR